MTNRLIATAALLAALFTGALTATALPCAHEDSPFCTWYADRQGNEQGQSFTDLGFTLIRH